MYNENEILHSMTRSNTILLQSRTESACFTIKPKSNFERKQKRNITNANIYWQNRFEFSFLLVCHSAKLIFDVDDIRSMLLSIWLFCEIVKVWLIATTFEMITSQLESVCYAKQTRASKKKVNKNKIKIEFAFCTEISNNRCRWRFVEDISVISTSEWTNMKQTISTKAKTDVKNKIISF